jgi:hypothetical protein
VPKPRSLIALVGALTEHVLDVALVELSLAVDALDVDAEQDCGAASGSLGDLGPGAMSALSQLNTQA